MKLVKEIDGKCKTFEGKNGQAVLTKNFGNKDKKDCWAVCVSVKGKYKKLATRVDFTKAYAMAENAID